MNANSTSLPSSANGSTVLAISLRLVWDLVLSVLIIFALCLPFVAVVQTSGQTNPQQMKAGIYHSAQHPEWPPLPFQPFPELPVADIGNGHFVYDDRNLDYEQIGAEIKAAAAMNGQSWQRGEGHQLGPLGNESADGFGLRIEF